MVPNRSLYFKDNKNKAFINKIFFQSDLGSESEEDDNWRTPVESPSRLSLLEDDSEQTEDDGIKIFVFG